MGVGNVLLLGAFLLELCLFQLVSTVENVVGSDGQDLAFRIVLFVPKPVVLRQIKLKSVKVRTKGV